MIMIYVVGQGPSGIMLAYMIKKKDPNVPLTLIDKNKKKKWHCTYGVWKNQLKNSWLYQIFGESMYTHSFDKIKVNFLKNKTQELNLPYAFLNNKKIKNHLQKNLLSRKLWTKNNDENFYIDCTGRKLNQNFNSTVGMQQFVGIEVKLKGKIPQNLNKMTLMDYSMPFDDPPTFCYIFPVNSNTLFMEETCLINKNSYDNKIFLNRIKIRMKKLNLKVKSWKIIEKEKIVMGGYRDDPKWISGKSFGASAGMIHRISGYMLSVMIPIVPTMAEIVLCKYYNRKIPKQIVSDFNHYKFLDKFYHLGQRMLLSMNHQQLNNFFMLFFNFQKKIFIIF